MTDLIPNSVLQSLFNLVPDLKFVSRSVINFAFRNYFIENSKDYDFEKTNVLNTSIKKRYYVSFCTKFKIILSNLVKVILKKIQHRSYYRALDLILFIPDLVQRNFLLEAFNSASSYLQNNYDVNIVKIWINKVWIKKDEKTNKLVTINQRSLKSLSFYSIIIEFGFYMDK